MIRYTKTHCSAEPDRTTVTLSGVTSLSVNVNASQNSDVALYATLGENESLSISFTREAAERLYRRLMEIFGPVEQPECMKPIDDDGPVAF